MFWLVITVRLEVGDGNGVGVGVGASPPPGMMVVWASLMGRGVGGQWLLRQLVKVMKALQAQGPRRDDRVAGDLKGWAQVGSAGTRVQPEGWRIQHPVPWPPGHPATFVAPSVVWAMPDMHGAVRTSWPKSGKRNPTKGSCCGSCVF